MTYKEVSIFCGGRGSTNIIKALLKNNFKRINLILNTYDDGLSTGVIRSLIPGITGPSDIRKNVNTYLEYKNKESLAQFLNYRLPQGSSIYKLKMIIHILKKEKKYSKSLPAFFYELQNLIEKTDFERFDRIIFYIFVFSTYFADNIDISDFTIGNIIFAGIYIIHKDNTKAIEDYTKLFIDDSRFYISDITNNGSLYLCAIKENGELLPDEYSITAPQSSSKISNLFFLKQPLSDKQINLINSSSTKIEILQSLSVQPVISEYARRALENSDLIIYGPGTQHSSLFPSYVTKGVSESIFKNKYAMKVFVLNISKDNDISDFSAVDIIKKFSIYMNCSFNIHRFIDYILYSATDEKNIMVRNDKIISDCPFGIDWIKGNFLNKKDIRLHDGNSIVEKIMDLPKKHFIKNKLNKSL